MAYDRFRHPLPHSQQVVDATCEIPPAKVSRRFPQARANPRHKHPQQPFSSCFPFFLARPLPSQSPRKSTAPPENSPRDACRSIPPRRHSTPPPTSPAAPPSVPAFPDRARAAQTIRSAPCAETPLPPSSLFFVSAISAHPIAATIAKASATLLRRASPPAASAPS